MKNILKKIVVFSSALLILAVFVLTACKKKNNSTDNGDNNTPSFPSTSINFIDEGTSEYKVVVGVDASYYERYAADEIINLTEEATGVVLPKITDENLIHSTGSKYISVGSTSLLSQAQLSIDKSSMSSQGYDISTKDSSVFITAWGDLGVLYGAYEFLHYQIGYEQYAPDEVAFAEPQQTVKLLDFAITDEPDIMWREPNYGPVNGVVASQRMRFTNNIWMRQNGNFVHNTFGEYFPIKTYYDTHNDWYSEDKNSAGDPVQLCYTARGNETEVENMRTVTLNRMKELVTYFYDRGQYLESISFTQEDVLSGEQWCRCSACAAMKSQYGTDSASLIKFINPVAKKMDEWMKETYPGRELVIAVFAYSATQQAPVTGTAGSYEPIDDSVILEKNIALFYAPYYADYFYDFNASVNSSYRETLDKWSVLSEKMYLWFYSTQFMNYLCWYDSFNSMQPIYQMAKEYSAYYIFDQGRYNASALTGFDYLKIYLNSKLGWNVDADVAALTQNFFDNYFKGASVPMKEYYDSYRLWMEHLRATTDISGTMQNRTPYTASQLPKARLLEWLGKIDEAYAAIERYKLTDSELYQKLHDRINKESIAIRYYLIDFFAGTYTSKDAQQLKQSFKDDATRLGFTMSSEMGSITSVYDKWKI